MNYVQLIIQGIIFVSYLIAIIYQFNTIKHLKTKLDVLEKFQSIFDLKKIDDYVKVIQNKADAEIEITKRSQLNKELKEAVEREARAQGETILNRYCELINVVADMCLEGSSQETPYFYDILPLNREFLIKVVEEKRKNV